MDSWARIHSTIYGCLKKDLDVFLILKTILYRALETILTPDYDLTVATPRKKQNSLDVSRCKVGLWIVIMGLDTQDIPLCVSSEHDFFTSPLQLQPQIIFFKFVPWVLCLLEVALWSGQIEQEEEMKKQGLWIEITCVWRNAPLHSSHNAQFQDLQIPKLMTLKESLVHVLLCYYAFIQCLQVLNSSSLVYFKFNHHGKSHLVQVLCSHFHY